MSKNCFAPGCDTGYSSCYARNKALGKKNPSLFSAPKDAELLKKWQRVIPRKDKVFERPWKLCELHFEPDCIDRAIELKLKDGSTYICERDNPLLKTGSVPTIFKNLPKYLSSKTPKRKAPTPRNSNKRIRLSSLENELPQSVLEEPKCNILEFELNDIVKPNKWWTVTKNQVNIICLKLDADCSCERHAVVSQDYSVKVNAFSFCFSMNAI